MLIFGIMVLITALILLFATLGLYIKSSLYKGRSAEVTGEIVHKRVVGARGNSRYEITVSYNVDGVAYKKTVTALKNEYNALGIGSPYTLLYRTDKPKKAIRTDMLDQRSLRIVTMIGAGMLALGAALCIIGSRL